MASTSHKLATRHFEEMMKELWFQLVLVKQIDPLLETNQFKAIAISFREILKISKEKVMQLLANPIIIDRVWFKNPYKE
jgi:hypothetical protein